MSSGVKIKSHDEMYSMFLVPKRLYYLLVKNTEDDELKKELISMNEKPETTNYIENAIKFKNLQDRQKIIQTGDKLLRFGSDKLPNVTSIANLIAWVVLTNLFRDHHPLKSLNEKKYRM